MTNNFVKEKGELLRENHNKRMLQLKNQQDIDPKTGQKLFTPKILRGPKVTRDQLAETMTKKMWSTLDTVDEDLKKKQEFSTKAMKSTIADTKRKVYTKIFQELDSDKDGYINPLEINTSSIFFYFT